METRIGDEAVKTSRAAYAHLVTKFREQAIEAHRRLAIAEADRDWFKRQRDDALEREKAIQSVLSDALAERLPPWLAELADHRVVLCLAIEDAMYVGGQYCCDSRYLHQRECELARLLRIVSEGETQRQVDIAHEQAIDMQSPGLAGWIAHLPPERDFPCDCGSALPRSNDLSMHTHNCNRACAVRAALYSPRAR